MHLEAARGYPPQSKVTLTVPSCEFACRAHHGTGLFFTMRENGCNRFERGVRRNAGHLSRTRKAQAIRQLYTGRLHHRCSGGHHPTPPSFTQTSILSPKDSNCVLNVARTLHSFSVHFGEMLLGVSGANRGYCASLQSNCGKGNPGTQPAQPI